MISFPKLYYKTLFFSPRVAFLSKENIPLHLFLINSLFQYFKKSFSVTVSHYCLFAAVTWLRNGVDMLMSAWCVGEAPLNSLGLAKQQDPAYSF